MFCMNCGQQLPEGAKFCLKCGTPQGAVSPTGTTQAETVNLDGRHSFVPAMCPNCNAHMKVDTEYKIARCDSCGTECLVQDAIKALSVNGNVSVGKASISVEGADTVNINAGGTNIDALLKRIEMMLADGDFSGAMEKCNSALDIEPTNGRTYYFMLMADLKCRTRQNLFKRTVPFTDNNYYVKAILYGDESVKNELKSCIEAIKEKSELIQQLGSLKIGNLKWKVLDISDGKALIISDSIVCNKAYGGKSWEDSPLRSWLNTSFVKETFDPNELEKIYGCRVYSSDDYSEYEPEKGLSTDRVFLLNSNEALRYFKDDDSRSFRNQPWWLRNEGIYVFSPSCVKGNGALDSSYYDEQSIGVRPAMWVELDVGTLEKLDVGTLESTNDIQIGSELSFGSYNSQAMWWKVLDIKDDKAYIISSVGIGTMTYNNGVIDDADSRKTIRWNNCYLRKWLNSVFLKQAFNTEEISRIITYDKTTDRINLLSVSEAKTLLGVTDRAKGYDWWLRSDYIAGNSPAYVSSSGYIVCNEKYPIDSRLGRVVRPAIWIRI